MRVKRDFSMYLIAYEFGISVDEVKSWKMKKIVEHSHFLNEYYKKKYGDPEELDQMNDMSIPKNPKPALKRLKGSGRGASGHTYKFK